VSDTVCFAHAACRRQHDIRASAVACPPAHGRHAPATRPMARTSTATRRTRVTTPA